jgi:hypothetical protein
MYKVLFAQQHNRMRALHRVLSGHRRSAPPGPARLRSTRKRCAQSLSEPMPLTPMRKEAGSPGGHQLEEQPWLCRIGRDHSSRKPQKPASSPASYPSCSGPCCSSSQHPSRSRRPVRTSRARRVLLETGIPVHVCDDKDCAPHPPAGPVRPVDLSSTCKLTVTRGSLSLPWVRGRPPRYTSSVLISGPSSLSPVAPSPKQ